MPISNKEENARSKEEYLSPEQEHEEASHLADESDHPEETVSEIALRINILGKLVIPPPTP